MFYPGWRFFSFKYISALNCSIKKKANRVMKEIVLQHKCGPSFHSVFDAAAISILDSGPLIKCLFVLCLLLERSGMRQLAVGPALGGTPDAQDEVGVRLEPRQGHSAPGVQRLGKSTF